MCMWLRPCLAGGTLEVACGDAGRGRHLLGVPGWTLLGLGKSWVLVTMGHAGCGHWHQRRTEGQPGPERRLLACPHPQTGSRPDCLPAACPGERGGGQARPPSPGCLSRALGPVGAQGAGGENSGRGWVPGDGLGWAVLLCIMTERKRRAGSSGLGARGARFLHQKPPGEEWRGPSLPAMSKVLFIIVLPQYVHT